MGIPSFFSGVIMQLFQRLYTNLGVRSTMLLVRPKVHPLNLFEFPRDSVFHSVNYGTETARQDLATFPYNGKSLKPVIQYKTDMVIKYPYAVKKPISPQKLVLQARSNNKDMRLLAVDIDKIPNPVLAVYDYSLLNDMYRYNKAPLQSYYEWGNINETVWSSIGDIVTKTDKEHFIIVNIPDIIPSYQQFSLFKEKVNTAMIQTFDSPDKLTLLDIFRWINMDTRERTFVGKVPNDYLHRVNIIFRFKETFTLMNLGYLDTMIAKPDSGASDKDLTMIKNQFIAGSGMMHTEPKPDKLVSKYFLSFLLQNQFIPTDNDDDDEENIDEDLETDEDIDDGLADPTEDADSDEADVSGAEDSIDDVVENDIAALDAISKKRAGKKDLLADLDTKVAAEKALYLPSESLNKVKEKLVRDPDPTTALKELIDKHAELEMLTTSEYRSLLKASNAIDNLCDPYSGDMAVKDMIATPQDLKIDKTKIAIADAKGVMDKTMLESSLMVFDSMYVKDIIKKDIVSSVLAVQKAGILILDYQVDPVVSVLGNYEIHTVKMRPIDGNPSSIRFKLPIVDREGNFVSNGNKYRMRKQRGDLPIRKINESVVGLSSYYGKLFVQRVEAKAKDPGEYLFRHITRMVSAGTAKGSPMDCFTNKVRLPRLYTAVSKNFAGVQFGQYMLNFNYATRKQFATDEQLLRFEEKGDVVVGTSSGKVILMDKDGFILDAETRTIIGHLYVILGINEAQVPNEVAEIKVLGKKIPLGIALGYLMGFDNLVKLLGLKPTVYLADEPMPKTNGMVITFKDLRLVFKDLDPRSKLLIAGYEHYQKSIKQYHFDAFNNQNVYMNIMDNQGVTARYIRELTLLDQMFVDPITKSILAEINEPQTFTGLLMRSAELLVDDYHKDTNDGSVMRMKGYERFPGMVYGELINSVRGYKSRTNAKRLQMEMSPYAVWGDILQDPTVKLVEDINVIQNLKDQEVVTYTGEGGRGKQSMSKPTRAFHANDIDTISEATVDSGDVGVNVYLSANPNFSTMRGISKPVDFEKFDATKRLSTATLLAPGSDGDDGKRVNLVSVQQSHTVAASGYQQPMVCTGYESVIANRAGELFAYTAKKAGVVKEINEKGIIIQYEDNEIVGLPLGTNYGRAEGSYYPHVLVTQLSTGDKIQPGDAVTYNTGYFEPDHYDPKKLILKGNAPVMTALYESRQTHEDSSAISSKVSGLMTTTTVKVKSFTVEFGQGISHPVKAGEKVSPDTILFYLTDEIANDTGLFDDATLSSLKRLQGKAPKAKYPGVISKIEVYYHGDKDDMSPSLKLLTIQSDKAMAARCKAIAAPVVTGSVNSEYRIEGTPIGINKAEIKIYILVKSSAGVGDKLVFVNQMKTVIGEVLTYPITTEDGRPVDAIFGSRSIAARIVTSPFKIGTTITVLKTVARNAVNLYKRRSIN